jgi:hypothetical protein
MSPELSAPSYRADTEVSLRAKTHRCVILDEVPSSLFPEYTKRFPQRFTRLRAVDMYSCCFRRTHYSKIPGTA